MSKSKIANFLKFTAKFITAGIVALLILSIIIYGYYIMPRHIKNPNGNTDYIWAPNSIWIKATEGVSYGKFDGNGYNNVKVIDDPDILVVGSSHIEATNVNQNKNAVYLLNDMFKGKHSVYNVGISGHDFMKCCQYLPDNIAVYKDSLKYIVIETSSLLLNFNYANRAVNHEISVSESRSGGIIGLLQKIPYLRAVYQNWYPVLSPAGSVSEFAVDEQANDLILDYLSKIEKDTGIQLIIAYQPLEYIDENGYIHFSEDHIKNDFSKKAEEYGIDIVDLRYSFAKMYKNDRNLPHGFITGSLASGHLNKYGHKAFAEAVYAKINELEGVY